METDDDNALFLEPSDQNAYEVTSITKDWHVGITFVNFSEGWLCGPIVLELRPRLSVLTELVLERVGMPLDAIAAFAILIANPATQLKRLTFEKSQLEHAEAMILIGALRTNTCLYHLDLSNNCLADAGEDVFVILADVLSVNTTLQSLQLEGCEINDESLFVLLREVRPLKQLRLDDNYISDDGFDALIETVAKTMTLEVLTITCGEYSNEVARLMADALDVNSSLLEFNMDAHFEYDEEEDEEDDGAKFSTALSRVTARTRLLAFLGAYAPKNRDGVPAFGF